MTYREWHPGPELADRVACFWTIGTERAAASGMATPAKKASGRPGDDGLKRIVPDGCMDIIWGPEGMQVAGPDTQAHLVPNRPGERYVAVRFRPGGAGTLFGVPADALTDARVPLRDLWAPAHLDDMGDRPPEGEGDILRLQQLLVARLRETGAADPVAPAVRRALAEGRPVPEVAAEVGYSVRTLRRRSLAAFGYGPKTLQRILRFQRAIELARDGMELATVAYWCGYADQAHLAGEVRALSGVPLSQLR